MTKTLGNGVTTAYQYDDSGALTRMAHTGLDGGGRSLAYAYEYDKNGNRSTGAGRGGVSKNVFNNSVSP